MTERGIPPEVWKSWRDFNHSIAGRDVVFFGAADDWISKTFRFSDPDVAFIADNSESVIGEIFMDWEVRSPEELRSGEFFVVITSGSYESIVPQLLAYGLQPGGDFCVSPALNNLRVITEIHSHEATLLISSPDHKIYSRIDADSDVGGGLYQYDLASRECRKVLDGTFHGMVDAGEVYYIADERRGICEISKDFELLDHFGSVRDDAPHGVAYCPERNLVFLSRTRLDRIAAFDAGTKDPAWEIELSDKYRRFGYSHHWINDLFVHEEYLYVSMFSHSGAYPQGTYDGGILQVDLEDPEKRQILVNDAWMPHTVRFFDTRMCYLDSMRGDLYKTDKRVIGEFPGFMRGLAFDGTFYYVGQSETRYFDRLKGVKKHIAMSAGFYLFDEETKAAKFFGLPRLRQVHDLLVI